MVAIVPPYLPRVFLKRASSMTSVMVTRPNLRGLPFTSPPAYWAFLPARFLPITSAALAAAASVSLPPHRYGVSAADSSGDTEKLSTSTLACARLVTNVSRPKLSKLITANGCSARIATTSARCAVSSIPVDS